MDTLHNLKDALTNTKSERTDASITRAPDTPLEIMADLLRKSLSAKSPEEKESYVKKALEISQGLDDYMTVATTTPSQNVHTMVDATLRNDWDAAHANGETKFKYTNNFCAGTFEAQFIATLCKLTGAKRVLEIGMFTGTTALACAESIPDDGKVYTCDIEPYMKTFSKPFFEKAGQDKKIEVCIAPAQDTLSELAKKGECFDLIFVDADKTGYLAYFQKIMDLGLLAYGGALVVDNTLFKGGVYTDSALAEVPEQKKADVREMTDALITFNKTVRDDPRVEVIVLPIRDGVSIITHKRPGQGDVIMRGAKQNTILQKFKLVGKVALVTGGGQGLGRAYCHALAEAGAAVAVVDLAFDKAEEVAKELKVKGLRAIAIQADVTSKADTEKMVDETVTVFGKLDIAVNNAGINFNSPAEDTSEREWDLTFNVNCKGVFLSCQAEARHMMTRPGESCSIINIASMASLLVPHPQKQAAYNCSKAAVVKLTQSLAVEWAPRGIRVNALSPGIVRTDLIEKSKDLQPLVQTWLGQIPMGRLAEVEDLMGPIIYLASDASAYATGHNHVVEGGQSLL
ncbi:hypothetical protein YB2330_005222 [Saitoella coloradoensis]